MDTESVLSLVLSAIAIVYAWLIDARTRRAAKLVERPMMSVYQQRIDKHRVRLKKSNEHTAYVLWFQLRNIGKRPADRLFLDIVVGEPEVTLDFQVSIANRVDPEAMLAQAFTIIEPETTATGDGNEDDPNKTVYILVRMNYVDAFDAKRNFRDEFWLTYVMGSDQLGHATIEQRQTFEPLISARESR